MQLKSLSVSRTFWGHWTFHWGDGGTAISLSDVICLQWPHLTGVLLSTFLFFPEMPPSVSMTLIDFATGFICFRWTCVYSVARAFSVANFKVSSASLGGLSLAVLSWMPKTIRPRISDPCKVPNSYVSARCFNAFSKGSIDSPPIMHMTSCSADVPKSDWWYLMIFFLPKSEKSANF